MDQSCTEFWIIPPTEQLPLRHVVSLPGVNVSAGLDPHHDAPSSVLYRCRALPYLCHMSCCVFSPTKLDKLSNGSLTNVVVNVWSFCFLCSFFFFFWSQSQLDEHFYGKQPQNKIPPICFVKCSCVLTLRASCEGQSQKGCLLSTDVHITIQQVHILTYTVNILMICSVTTNFRMKMIPSSLYLHSVFLIWHWATG